ncbi:MAG: hypothetical protein J0H25_04110, partial [Rhizobiales bacterium]|nr:hypothetical protein [Hyphomicrobiales bacterium]
MASGDGTGADTPTLAMLIETILRDVARGNAGYHACVAFKKRSSRSLKCNGSFVAVTGDRDGCDGFAACAMDIQSPIARLDV